MWLSGRLFSLRLFGLWVLFEGLCSRVRRVERSVPPFVVFSCGSGILVGSRCFEYAEPLRVCSPGWVLRAGSCERVAQQSTPRVWGPPGVPSG